MDTAKAIALIAGRGDLQAGLMMDVLRALAAFNGVLWESELAADIAKVHGYCVESVPSDEELRRAVDELAKMELVEVSEHVRGQPLSRGTYTDRLVKLRDTAGVIAALSGDPVYRRYMASRVEAFKRVLQG